MKSLKLASIIFVTIFYSTNSFCDGYVGNGTIKTMQNVSGGWILNTNGAANNPDNCSKDTVILQSTQGQYKELYALLLSAYTAVKPVNIYVSGCDKSGYKIFSYVHTVWNN